MAHSSLPKPSRVPVLLRFSAFLLLLLAAVATGVAAEHEPTLRTPKPTRWLPSKGKQCKHRGKYRHLCDGPRRVPAPHGHAADLADELGLGTRATASRLLSRGPRRSWVAAVDSEPERSLLWPVPDGRFGRGFGYTRKSRRDKLHKGIDVTADEGAYTRSVNDGLVAYSDNGISGYGNVVLVVHADRSFSLYAHQRANYVFAGQRVRRGQVLGEVGQTGIAWGPHLHFEWYQGGRPRNPMRRMVDVPRRQRSQQHHM